MHHPSILLDEDLAPNVHPNQIGEHISCNAIPNDVSLNRPAAAARPYSLSTIYLLTDWGEIVTYQIPFQFRPDPNGRMRASTKNLWNDPNITSHPHGLVILQKRIEHGLGIKPHQLSRNIYRYRLNYVCTYPDVNLFGVHLHHKTPNTSPFTNSRFWLAATKDVASNLSPLTPEEHQRIHLKQGDTEFYFYNQSPD